VENEYLIDIERDLQETLNVFESAIGDESFKVSVSSATKAVCLALQGGSKLLVAGNGGSAADAQHIAAELVSRFNFDRAPLPAIALTTDTSILTAIGNDYGYEELFARQIRALGRPGDVLLALSTSGRSRNILAGLDAAGALGITRIGLTGSNASLMREKSEFTVSVPSSQTPFIQHMHIAVGHIICGLVERELFSHNAD
jgi:D-sedoheptulose 7-phosphate isomerase